MFPILKLILLFSCGFLIFISFFLYPPLPYYGEERINIRYNMDASNIASILKGKGLISSKRVFLYLSRILNTDTKFSPGIFNVPRGLRVDKVIRFLLRAKPEVVWVTIPEGFNSKEIAQRLESAGVVSKEAFLSALNNRIEGNYPSFISPPYEGFLFPDTYEFYIGMKPELVIKKFLDRFIKVLPSDFEKKALRLNLSPRETIILASLVEKEARFDYERPIIAQVLLKRLKIGMKLQCDATIQYLLDKPKERLTYDDLKIQSPYNTYLYYGLPPGAISNPGLSSIKAVINPSNTDYLYYVAKGDGHHIFSKTYKEHLLNQIRY
ncbi:MAG: endolytic transglycosylase MltG [bacterium]